MDITQDSCDLQDSCNEYDIRNMKWVLLAKGKQAQRISEHIITCTYSLYNDRRIHLVKMKALERAAYSGIAVTQTNNLKSYEN